MSRIRSIKPSLFIDDRFAECSLAARYLFIGLPCIADSEGRLEDRPRRIKAQFLPYDDADIDALLNELVEKAFIVRYEVDGKRCIWIVDFKLHQQPHINEKKKGSELPPPPADALPKGVTLPPDDPPPSPRPRPLRSMSSEKNHTCTILRADSSPSRRSVVLVDEESPGSGFLSISHEAAQWLILELQKLKPRHNIHIAPDFTTGMLQVVSGECPPPTEPLPLPPIRFQSMAEIMATYTHAAPKPDRPSPTPSLLPA